MTPLKPPEVSRFVVTPESEPRPTTANQVEMVTPGANLEKSVTESRSVITTQTDSVSKDTRLTDYNKSRSVTTDLDDELEQAELTAAADRNIELHLLLDDEQGDSRFVATNTDLTGIEQTEIEAAETLLQLRDTDTADTSQDEEATTDAPKHNDMEIDTPEENEILSQDEEATTDAPTHDNMEIDIPDENEILLPVDAPMQEDFANDMAEAEKARNPDGIAGNTDNNDDNAETIIYDLNTPSSKTTPKRGTVTFKHYGIRRHSPCLATVRKHRCPLCDKSVNSKKELNDHHRAEHEGVKCPTCDRIFPTADAYQ